MLGSKNVIRRMRCGAAMVELAICLPIYFMIAMATIETCRMIYVRQSLKIAAYECARLGIVPTVDHQMLKDQCELFLRSRRIRGFEFSCEPEDPRSLKYGDLLTIRIEASAEANDLIGTWFLKNRTFQESAAIMAEY